MSACRAADQRFQELARRIGSATLVAAIAAIHQRAEQQMRTAYTRLPAGVYRGEDFLDDDGAGQSMIAIRVRIDISGDEATFDFSESDNACAGPVNTTPYIAAASVFYVLKTLVGIDIQPCGGCYRPLRVITRPGSIFNPEPERPLSEEITKHPNE